MWLILTNRNQAYMFSVVCLKKSFVNRAYRFEPAVSIKQTLPTENAFYVTFRYDLSTVLWGRWMIWRIFTLDQTKDTEVSLRCQAVCSQKCDLYHVPRFQIFFNGIKMVYFPVYRCMEYSGFFREHTPWIPKHGIQVMTRFACGIVLKITSMACFTTTQKIVFPGVVLSRCLERLFLDTVHSIAGRLWFLMQGSSTRGI